MSSDGEKVKVNLRVFDSNDYDENGNYACVKSDQDEWYKAKSGELKEENGGDYSFKISIDIAFKGFF